jgi:hypothetical protein
MRVLALVIALSALMAVNIRALTGEPQSSHSLERLHCAGVSARIPGGWHGLVRQGRGGAFTFTLASFPLVAEADAVDEQSAKRMSLQDVLVLLIAYGRGQADPAAFKRRVQLPLTVERMTVYGTFEHLPRGHRLTRILFLADGGTYDAQVQFARPLSTGLRRKADSALRLVHFRPPPRQSSSGRTRC